MAYFCQLRLKLSYKIQKNPFRMFIRVQICIEFHQPPYEIPQLWSHYCRAAIKLGGVFCGLNIICRLQSRFPNKITNLTPNICKWKLPISASIKINPIPTKGGHFGPGRPKAVSHFHSFMTRVTKIHDFVHFSIPLVPVKLFLKKEI